MTKTKTENKANEKNEKKDMKKKMIIIGVALAILLIAVIILLSFSGKPKSTPTGLALDDFYSSDRCRCLERENYRCTNSSWKLDEERRLCIYGKRITNVILGCSKYECSGITYQFNKDINGWEVK